ncbi:mevalonate kinase [Brachybacterium hainanense]|uniref:mevalonate kinase n=1 Tax=Brachybacterium hainanense TaxID=1541174 RepID=A0ABV6R762_9MICO
MDLTLPLPSDDASRTPSSGREPARSGRVLTSVRPAERVAGGLVRPLPAHLPVLSPTPVDGTGRAHGKAILIGEHAVVYGAAAIALPVPSVEAIAQVELLPAGSPGSLTSRLHTGPLATVPAELMPVAAAVHAAAIEVGLDPDRLHVRIDSEVPIGRGMGSSAAVAAAVVAAVADAAGRTLSPEVRHELIQESERVAHGNPSGLDARTVVADAPVRFLRRRPQGAVPVGAPVSFVIADSGVSASTAVAVATVRARREAAPAVIDGVIEELGALVDPVADALATGEAAALGAGMTRAHHLLREIGVSSPVLDDLVEAALGVGAAGAKLTGSGGGGCVLALARTPGSAGALAAALRAAGAPRTWTMTLPKTPDLLGGDA